MTKIKKKERKKKKKNNNHENGKLHYYKKRDNVPTPKNLYKFLDDIYHFDFDPCPIDPKFDGLVVPWGKMNYVNPPYSQIKKWVAKAIEEKQIGNSTLFLITVRTSTKYWFDYIFPQATRLWFIQDGITFESHKRPLPIPLCLCLFSNRDSRHDIRPPLGLSRHALDGCVSLINENITTLRNAPVLLSSRIRCSNDNENSKQNLQDVLVLYGIDLERN